MKLKCLNCGEELKKGKGDRVMVGQMDEEGIEIEIYCPCGYTNILIASILTLFLDYREGEGK